MQKTNNFKKAPEKIELFKNKIERIDWPLLAEQKESLISIINMASLKHAENLTGLLYVIDSIQDYATDELKIDEKIVFPKVDQK